MNVSDKALHKTVDTIHVGMETRINISNFKKAHYFKSIGLNVNFSKEVKVFLTKFAIHIVVLKTLLKYAIF